MTICVLGERNELMPGYVGGFAERTGVDVVWLSESELGETWFFDYSDDHPATGHLQVGDRRIGFEEITGSYVNLSPKPSVPDRIEHGDEGYEAFLVLRRASIRHLINALPGVVANRPCAGRSNNSKPYQMQMLEKAGFRVPAWIASSDLDAVEQFVEEHAGEVVVKSCSGLRSEVRIYDDAMATSLREGTTPIIAQERIHGSDVRAHTLPTHTLATRIQAKGVDYRFAEGPKTHSVIELPARLDERCHRFARSESMVIAGFDFRLTDAGEWYCLEMNPVPTFLPYEFETGQPICRSLVEALSGTVSSD